MRKKGFVFIKAEKPDMVSKSLWNDPEIFYIWKNSDLAIYNLLIELQPNFDPTEYKNRRLETIGFIKACSVFYGEEAMLPDTIRKIPQTYGEGDSIPVYIEEGRTKKTKENPK